MTLYDGLTGIGEPSPSTSSSGPTYQALHDVAFKGAVTVP